MTVIAQNLTWTQTLDSIRENFFTSDTLRELKNQNLYRHQHQHEHLADCVKDIKTLHTILSPNTPEQETFQTIFRSINQQTRTTFAGLKPIMSIQDLLDVAPLPTSLLNQPTQYSQIDQLPTTSRAQYHNNSQFRPNRDTFLNSYQHRHPHWQTNYPTRRYQTQQPPTHHQFSSPPPNYSQQHHPSSNPSRGYPQPNYSPRDAYPYQTLRYTSSNSRTNQHTFSDNRRNLNFPRGGGY